MNRESESVRTDQQETSRRDDVFRERARIRDIQTCPEAKGRGGLAKYISLESDLTPEQARKILAASPKNCGVLFHCTEPSEYSGGESPLVAAIKSNLPRGEDVTLIKLQAAIG